MRMNARDLVKVGVAVSILAAVTQGCAAVEGLADAPTQIVMVHTTDQPGAFPTTYATAFPPGGGEVDSLAPNRIGPRPDPQPTARQIPPGIAANNEMYVVASWGTDDDVNYRLNLFASGNGRSWAPVACPATFTARDLEFGNSPEASRPAVAFFPERGTWFVAIRDRASDSIMVAELDISAGEPPYQCTVRGQPRPVGVTSTYAPALGYAGDRLVVVYVRLRPVGSPAPPPPQRPTGLELFAVTSTDAFSTPATPPGALILDPTIVAPMLAQSIEPVGPPYLDNTLGELTLTTGLRPPANRLGNPGTGVFTSADGVAWTTVTTLPTGFGSGYGPASAGSTSDRIVVIPRSDRQGFFVSIAGSTPTARAILDSYGVGLSKGPGPVSATTHVCAANQLLTVRTASGDVTGFGLHPKVFPTSGDFELLCSPPTTTRSGICAENTTYATVRGNAATGRYVVECWRRYPGSYP